MDWLYRFTVNNNYPYPLEEIDAICTLYDDNEPVFLLLANGNSPPMSRASEGDVVGLCRGMDGRLILEGVAIVDGPSFQGQTPDSVIPIYGYLAERTFIPLRDVKRKVSDPLDESVLSAADQECFLSGQSFVKRLREAAGTRRAVSRHARIDDLPPEDANSQSPPAFTRIRIPQCSPEFSIIGLDPTAGTWDSCMTAGPKDMPSFSLKWNGETFECHQDPPSLQWHKSNEEFWNAAAEVSAVVACIDGPCGTNGPELTGACIGWEEGERDGSRSGELELSRNGINLFWTTQKTVLNFDGASRWIARSLVLFSEQPKQIKIETHPHGAFTFLWRLFGGTGSPPKKTTHDGRQTRLTILRSFIPNLLQEIVPDHDAMDAACAALVAGLHRLHLTKSFGTVDEGGLIWMPDIEKLKELVNEDEGDRV